MRMRGAWHIYAPGERWRRPAHEARAVLTFEDVVAVLFAAPVVELVRDERTRIGHLGPDVLSDDFDVTAVLRLARRSDRAEIGDLLLDQRVCAGIGNIYKCETMWIHRVNPWTPAADLGDGFLSEVYRTARDLMRASVVAGRAPARRAVHARGGRPCPRCSTPVAVRPQGPMGRLTYYCRRCQGGPAAAHPAIATQPEESNA